MEYADNVAVYGFADGVFSVRVREGLVLDLAAAAQLTAVRIGMQHERTLPVLYDLDGISDSDKAGRDYFARHAPILASAIGIYAKRKIPLVIARFVVKLQQPPIPIKISGDREAALSFLRPFL